MRALQKPRGDSRPRLSGGAQLRSLPHQTCLENVRVLFRIAPEKRPSLRLYKFRGALLRWTAEGGCPHVVRAMRI